MIFSDAHYWPGKPTTAHRGLVKIVKALKPELVIANGDMIDGARISRFARRGWEHCPKLAEELAATDLRLSEVERAAPRAKRKWPMGNHDERYENYLANNAQEFAGVQGFSLRDHFPTWEPCWQVNINGDTVVKHRWKGGRGANSTYNNVKESGTNIVTGHLHSSKTTPYTNYRGTLFGVDCGTVADPEGPQFLYNETNPLDWRSGFVVLRFHNGKLLWPEHVHVIDEEKGLLSFRGDILEV